MRVISGCSATQQLPHLTRSQGIGGGIYRPLSGAELLHIHPAAQHFSRISNHFTTTTPLHSIRFHCRLNTYFPRLTHLAIAEMRHAVLLGASRGIAYYTTLNLLSTDEWTCTLLLRKPEALAADPKLTPYVESGKLVFVKGNGTSVEDVAKLFDKPVDVVITSIGEQSLCTLPRSPETDLRLADPPRRCTPIHIPRG